jgi:hypothetical protein
MTDVLFLVQVDSVDLGQEGREKGCTQTGGEVVHL